MIGMMKKQNFQINFFDRQLLNQNDGIINFQKLLDKLNQVDWKFEIYDTGDVTLLWVYDDDESNCERNEYQESKFRRGMKWGVDDILKKKIIFIIFT